MIGRTIENIFEQQFVTYGYTEYFISFLLLSMYYMYSPAAAAVGPVDGSRPWPECRCQRYLPPEDVVFVVYPQSWLISKLQ